MTSPEPAPEPTATYRLAPALGARLVGRSLVTLAVLVVVVTVVDAVAGIGWAPVAAVAVPGLGLAAAWSWFLLRRAWTVRLTTQGYVVRLLSGVGVRDASWAEVAEVLATSPGGRPCLVVRLRDGRSTRLPMAAIAGDADRFARDVRDRVRDAHTRER
ncbi:MAG TPA: hypothetical protein VHW64_03675 [Nocardioides sp.]|jgi:hypothetical protein|uniref:hypothetical protein n=1 Tax=Nocardioides sp. TaxID=35761 RepID=UPI002E36482C|nr:hypothetical protein [Nocardioides sp.]HEX3929777.1 hypothetical protein [Nocardioides sp.]